MEGLWYKKLGFPHNPLNIRPNSQETYLLGYDEVIKDLNYHIETGNMVFLEGESGSGKTSVLKEIIKQFRGRRRIVYYSASQIEDKFSLDKLISYKQSVFGGLKTVKKLPHGMILLLDEVNQISHNNAERLKFFFDEGIIKSVVFTGTSFEEADFSDSLKNRIGNRIVEVNKFKLETAKKMLSVRLGPHKSIISDEFIKEIYNYSKGNPRLILENTEDLLNLVFKRGDPQISREHLRELFIR